MSETPLPDPMPAGVDDPTVVNVARELRTLASLAGSWARAARATWSGWSLALSPPDPQGRWSLRAAWMRSGEPPPASLEPLLVALDVPELDRAGTLLNRSPATWHWFWKDPKS
jgi:hypothetical protein